MINKNILIVIDDINFDWNKYFNKFYKPKNKYYLLAVGFNANHIISEVKYKNINISDFVKVININKAKECIDDSARNAFLKFVRDFPYTKLKNNKSDVFNILQYNNFNLWWYLQITEKSIWMGTMIHRLHAYYMLKYAITEYNISIIYLNLNDYILNNILQQYLGYNNIRFNTNYKKKPTIKYSHVNIIYKYYKNTICYVAYNIFIKFILILTGLNRNKNIENSTIGFFSIYPLWWNELKNGMLTEKYFNDIPNLLKNKYPVKILVFLNGLKLIKSAKYFRDLRNKKYIIINNYLRMRDLALLFSPFILYKLLAIKKLIDGKNILLIDGVDFSLIAKDEINESLTEAGLIRNMIIYKSLRNIDKANIIALLFRLEFQTLERPLISNFKNKARIFGIQHSAMSDNYLNYVFMEKELANSKSNILNSMPIPDVIFTCGKLAYQYLLKGGIDLNSIFIAGPLRFSGLLHKMKNIKPAELIKKNYNIATNRQIIFIPMSQVLHENICLVKDLITATNMLNREYHVVIKINPNKEDDAQFKQQINNLFEVSSHLLTIEYFDKNNDYLDFITLADIVLLSGGSVAFESVVLHSPPIIYISNNSFSHNPMVKYPESAYLVSNSIEISTALVKADNIDFKNGKIYKSQRAIEDIFGDINISPQKKLINKLYEYI